jgi:UDP-glucose:(heptosyl)LPS alpha-1,3-glucosyltransferase
LKIAFIAYAVAEDGGIEKVVYQLAAAASRRGHQVWVVAARYPEAGIQGVTWMPVFLPRLPWALRQWAFALASRLALRGKDFDLLHASAPTFAPAEVAVAHSVHAFGAALVRSGIPSRWGRVWDWIKTLSPLTNWLSGINYRSPRLKVAVAISATVKAELEALYPHLSGRIQVIPNGVDLARYRPLPLAKRQKARKALEFEPGDLVVAFVARQFMQKGLEPLLRALALLPKKFKLLVAGANVDPLPESYYHRVVRELGLEARVRFLGQVQDSRKVFQVADVLVHPVLYEAFGLVLLEAFACSIPVLATQVGGPSELVIQGVNGAFIERDAASIAAALRRWILNPALRRGLNRGALKTARHFRWSRSLEAHMKLCRSLAP